MAFLVSSVLRQCYLRSVLQQREHYVWRPVSARASLRRDWAAFPLFDCCYWVIAHLSPLPKLIYLAFVSIEVEEGSVLLDVEGLSGRGCLEMALLVAPLVLLVHFFVAL